MALNIKRYPPTNNTSLRSFSSADELILAYINDQSLHQNEKRIFNDRFGYLYCHLIGGTSTVVVQWKSQEIAIRNNLRTNNLVSAKMSSLLEVNNSQFDLGIVRIPKSMDLFRLYLDEICKNLSSEGEVVCGFMTKYFSKQMLTIAENHFHSVYQSKAFKKARLLHLKEPKPHKKINLLRSVSLESSRFGLRTYQQYLGVFSKNHIDYATQFLLDRLPIYENVEHAMDLASGNGIIADCLHSLYPDAHIHLVEDSFLALESSRINLVNKRNVEFHYTNEVVDFSENFFDLIVTNPPFHFGHEINIEVSLILFQQAHLVLKNGGRLVIVANRHLNYKSHLTRVFKDVLILHENKSFVIYECSK